MQKPGKSAVEESNADANNGKLKNPSAITMALKLTKHIIFMWTAK